MVDIPTRGCYNVYTQLGNRKNQMNDQAKVNFIEAHPEHFERLSLPITTYASNETASFNKVLHNGRLQFKGWNGNTEGFWNVDLTNSDYLDELFDQMTNLVLFK